MSAKYWCDLHVFTICWALNAKGVFLCGTMLQALLRRTSAPYSIDTNMTVTYWRTACHVLFISYWRIMPGYISYAVIYQLTSGIHSLCTLICYDDTMNLTPPAPDLYLIRSWSKAKPDPRVPRKTKSVGTTTRLYNVNMYMCWLYIYIFGGIIIWYVPANIYWSGLVYHCGWPAETNTL